MNIKALAQKTAKQAASQEIALFAVADTLFEVKCIVFDFASQTAGYGTKAVGREVKIVFHADALAEALPDDKSLIDVKKIIYKEQEFKIGTVQFNKTTGVYFVNLRFAKEPDVLP